MSKNTVPCRVCGKEFVPCNRCFRVTGVFNWREVACSAECGNIYLDRVTSARQILKDSNDIKEELKTSAKTETEIETQSINEDNLDNSKTDDTANVDTTTVEETKVVKRKRTKKTND